MKLKSWKKILTCLKYVYWRERGRKKKKMKVEGCESDMTKKFINDKVRTGNNSNEQSFDGIFRSFSDISVMCSENTTGCAEVTIEVDNQYPVQETESSTECYTITPTGSKISYLSHSSPSATLDCTDNEELVSHRFKEKYLVTDVPKVMTTDNILDSQRTDDNSLTKETSDKKSYGKPGIKNNAGDANLRQSMCGKLNAENYMFNSLVNSSLMDPMDNDQTENFSSERAEFIQESELCKHTEQSVNFLKPESPDSFLREGRVCSQNCELRIHTEQSLYILKPESPDTDDITLLKRVANSEFKSDSERSPSTVSSSSESSDDYPTGYPRESYGSYILANSSLSSQVLTESVTCDCPVEPLSVQSMDYKFQKDSFHFEIIGKLVMIEYTEENCIFDFVFVEKIEDVLLSGIKASLDYQHDRNDTFDGQNDFEEEPFVTQTHGCNIAIKGQTDHEFGQTDVIDNSLPSSSYDKMQNKEHEELVEASSSDNQIKSNGYPANANTSHGRDTEENVLPVIIANQIIRDEQSDTEFHYVQHDSCKLAETVLQQKAENYESLATDFSETKLENIAAKYMEDKFREMKQDHIPENKQLSVVQNVLTMEDRFLGKQYPALMMVLKETPLKQIVITGLPVSVTYSPFEKYSNLTWIYSGIINHMDFKNFHANLLQKKVERGNQEKNKDNFSSEGIDTVGLIKINFVYLYLYLEPVLHVSELNDLDIGEQICLEKELKQQQKKSGKQRKKHKKKKKKTSHLSTSSPPSMMGYQLPSSDSSIEDENLYRHSKPRKYCRKCQKNCSHCLCASSHFQPRAETEGNVFEALINKKSLDSGLGTMQSLYSFHSSLESIAKQKLLSMKKATAAKTLKEVELIKSSLCSLEERIKGITRDLSHFRPINVDVALYPGLNSYFERFPSGSTPTLSQQMQFEWLRVSSFGTYTGQGSCINLARNGFYAEPDAGPAATRCCKCGVVVTDWEYLDNVADRHRQLSPNCPFVTGRDTEEGNVSIFDEASTTTSVTPEPQVNTGTSEGASALSVGHLANAEFTSVASTRSATQASSSSSSGASSSESSKSQENKLTSVSGDSKEVEPYQPVEDAENQSLPRLGGGTRDKPAQAAPSSRPPGNNAPGTSGAVGAGAFASQGGGGGAMTATRSLLDEMISTLENQLGGEWMLVALNLGLTQVDIERTQELEPHSTRRQIQSALTRWRKSSAFTDMGKIESLIQALEESGRNDLADVLKDRRDALRRSESNPGASGSPMPLEGVGNPEFVIVENPKHPNYSSVDARISSYRGWPSTLGQSARQMAAAGFYYAGVSDFTRCFCCGGGLRNWETGDDPILEHTRWFPECEFVNRLKGRTYVNRISRRQEEHLAAQRRQALEQERRLAALRNAPDPLESAAAQTLLEMGYPQERVRTAITELRRTSGNVTVSADQAVRFLLDEEERQPGSQDIPPVVTGGNLTQRSTLTNASNSARAGSPVGPQSLRAGGSSATGTQGASEGSESQAGPLTSSVSTTAVAGSLTGKVQGKSSPATVIEGKDTSGEKRNSKSGKKKKKKTKAQTQGSNLSGEVHGEIDAQSLRVENERLRDMHKCKICMERMVDTTILPCGHLVCCGECASRVNQCPICRAQIKGTVKTFLS